MIGHGTIGHGRQRIGSFNNDGFGGARDGGIRNGYVSSADAASLHRVQKLTEQVRIDVCQTTCADGANRPWLVRAQPHGKI